MIHGLISYTATAVNVLALIYKNGVESSIGSPQPNDSIRSSVSDIIYMNGSTDYIELFAYNGSTGGRTIENVRSRTFMSGCLIRSA
jgi:hypothetical protein